MDLQQYHKNRRKQQEEAPKFRELCSVCIQPQFSCYCTFVQRFNPRIHFVILIHPIEVRRRIATGRMTHLCLDHSFLIAGQDYTKNSEVNALINDPHRRSLILYPGRDSLNLSTQTEVERKELFSTNKKLTIFVIDGTWATAKKMIRESENLKALPRVCFTPERPSNFRVRKQPHSGCYSTIEAVHQTIELLGTSQGFDVQGREHDKLLHVFDSMVERQLEFIRLSQATGRSTYRRVQRPIS